MARITSTPRGPTRRGRLLLAPATMSGVRMLAKMNGSNETLRVQCPFISEEEVSAITDHLRKQGAPVYHDDILRADDDEEEDFKVCFRACC